MINSNWVTVNSFFYVLCFLQKLRKDPLPCEKNNLNLCLYINTEPVKAATDQTGIHVWILSTFILQYISGPATRHIDMSMVSEYVYEYVYRCICSSRDWLGILCRDSEKFRQSDNIILYCVCDTLKYENCSLLEDKVEFPTQCTVLIGHVTGDNFLSLKHGVRLSQQLSRVPSSGELPRICIHRYILYTRICVV